MEKVVKAWAAIRQAEPPLSSLVHEEIGIYDQFPKSRPRTLEKRIGAKAASAMIVRL